MFHVNHRMRPKRSAAITIEVAVPDLPAAAEILRDYLCEMIGRYYGRPTNDAEIDRYLRASHGNDDLAEPAALLLLARSADGTSRSRPVGCVGLRWLDEGPIPLRQARLPRDPALQQ